MKKVILGLMLVLSASAFAEKATYIYPQVYNFGYSVQVQVWNNTDKQVYCSGFVNMSMENGAMESQHYSEYVSANYSSYRTLYPRVNSSQRISSTFHSIYCN